MKNRFLYIIIYLLGTLFFAGACTWEDPLPEPVVGKDAKYLSFVIKSESEGDGTLTRTTPTRSSVVPGEDSFNENYIDFNAANKDVHIFFFALNGTDCIFYPENDRLIYDAGTNIPGGVTVNIDTEAGATYEEFDAQELLIGKNVILYVVANSGLPRSAFVTDNGDGTETVKPLRTIMEQTYLVNTSFNLTQAVSGGTGIVPQTKFVMDARSTIYVAGWVNMATMNMKRVASKIELGIYNAQVSGYTLESAEVMLCNYVTQGALGLYGTAEAYTPVDSDYDDSDYISVPMPPASGQTSDAEYADPFYSYPSNWSDNEDRAAYLLLKMNWYENGDQSTVKPYYYKLPISNISSDDEEGAPYRYALRRNHIYRYYVTVNTLGGAEPGSAATLSGNLDIMEWDTQNVATSIQKFDWLFVEERNIIIYPVPGQTVQEYLIPYKSNTSLTATPGETYVTYEDYTVNPVNLAQPIDNPNYSGLPTDAQLTQYPYIDVNYVVGTQRYIRIRSKTPVNFVPKSISIKVQNEALLYAIVDIIHYPALYVTGKVLSGNTFSFTVTTLAIMGDETFPSPNYQAVRNKHYRIGSIFVKNSQGRFELPAANDNADNAWVVSPKFTIQSQLNPSGTEIRSSAISYCQTFSEGGMSGWRLPTIAELYLIYKLQNDSNSALRNALVGGRFEARAWAAGTYFLHDGSRNSNGTIFQMRSAGAGGNTYIGDELDPIWFFGYHHVPVCVRDFYQ